MDEIEYNFLLDLMTKKTQVTVFTVKGVALIGIIEIFDENIILLKSTRLQLIYKHSISCIEQYSPKEQRIGLCQ